jgi:hypothetical protein
LAFGDFSLEVGLSLVSTFCGVVPSKDKAEIKFKLAG